MARDFYVPKHIISGENALESADLKLGKKALIVTDPKMVKLGNVTKVETALDKQNVEHEVFDGITGEPTDVMVREGVNKYKESNCDFMIAIGGGSPIDAAKAMWIKYEYPETTFEDMCKVFGLPKLRTKAHFCAVSSTSGTATEVTAFSIITDYQKGVKLGFGA